jgi:Rrf2 family protein
MVAIARLSGDDDTANWDAPETLTPAITGWCSPNSPAQPPEQAFRANRPSLLACHTTAAFCGLTFHPIPSTSASTVDQGAMLTQKGKYGLKAMLYLAEQPPEVGVRGLDIASAQNIPKKFLDLILLELKRHGLISSKKGRQGGYQLAKPAEHIPVGHIIRVLDGPLAPVLCVSRTAYRPCPDCTSEAACRIRHLMGRVRDAMAGVLDHASLADLTRAPMQDFILNYDI